MATYALDRMLSVVISDEKFEMPKDFSPEDYFAEYYGITTDNTPMTHVVIRAYGNVSYYLLTRPLHASQKEVDHTADYTDFSYDIRPSVDFVLELMSYTDGLEVLEPVELRQKIYHSFQASLERYSN